jgi:hypothetical protein
VTAVDISRVALDRAIAAAQARNLLQRIDFQSHELPDSFPAGTFDLVSAQFLHSTVALDRPLLLRRAAEAVTVGGTLLIVDHAGAPPWASKLDHHHESPSAEEVVSSLNLNNDDWERRRVESVEREATGPDGQTGVPTDNVIVLRRTGNR